MKSSSYGTPHPSLVPRVRLWWGPHFGWRRRVALAAWREGPAPNRGRDFSTSPLEIQIPGAEIEPQGIPRLTTPGPHHAQLRIIRYSRGLAAPQGETAPARVSLLL